MRVREEFLQQNQTRKEDLKVEERLSDTVKSILELHFERFTKELVVDKIIKDYGMEDDQKLRIQGIISAVSILHKAVNWEQDSFQEFIKAHSKPEPDENLLALQHNLLTLSNQCSGNIKSEDPVFVHCSRLSTLDEKTLKSQIGVYFKEQINSYLKEKHGHIYNQIERDFQSKNLSNSQICQ